MGPGRWILKLGCLLWILDWIKGRTKDWELQCKCIRHLNEILYLFECPLCPSVSFLSCWAISKSYPVSNRVPGMSSTPVDFIIINALISLLSFPIYSMWLCQALDSQDCQTPTSASPEDEPSRYTKTVEKTGPSDKKSRYLSKPVICNTPLVLVVPFKCVQNTEQMNRRS